MLISLNAMRVGLLTRFMGVLGIITGALQILPFGGPLPVVQCFWLIMLGCCSSAAGPTARRRACDRHPRALAEPGPVREQRRRASAAGRAERRAPARRRRADPEPVAAGPSPSASARKRKRKRALAVEPGDLPNAVEWGAVAEGAVGAPLVVVAHPVWQ